MKVLIVAQSAGPFGDGLSTYVSSIADGLRARGVELLVVTGRPLDVQMVSWPFEVAPGLEEFCNGGEAFFQSIKALSNCIRSFIPNIVVCQDPLSALAVQLARPAEAKFGSILTLHWTCWHWQSGASRFKWISSENASVVERDFLRGIIHSAKLSECIAVGPSFRRWLLELGVASTAVTYVPNLVDARRFYPIEATAESPLIPLLLIPGRLIPRKGQMELLRVLAPFLRANCVRTLICGSRRGLHPAALGYGESLRELIREQGLKDIVRVTSLAQDEMPTAYQRATVVLLPSYSEGMSTVMLEAMACAKPVIATDIDGHTPVIRNGLNGILVPVGNFEAFVPALNSLLGDRLRRESLGQHARFTVLGNYDVPIVIEQLLQVFERVAGKSSGVQ